MSGAEGEPGAVHEELRDDLAAYALGALSSVEADGIAAHLRGCQACSSYVQGLERAVDLLPASAPSLEPPARLNRELMGAIQADARRERRQARASRGWRGPLLRPAIGLAVSAVLLAGAIVGYELRPGNGGAGSTLIPAKQLSSVPGGGTLAATLEREGSRGILHVTKLPDPPGDAVYQTWLQRDGKMNPSTTFVVRGNGRSEVAIEGDLSTADALFVTTEPKGGSDFPTTQPILKAPLK